MMMYKYALVYTYIYTYIKQLEAHTYTHAHMGIHAYDDKMIYRYV